MDIFHSGSRFEPTVQIESGKLRIFDFSDLFSIFPVYSSNYVKRYSPLVPVL